MVDREEVSAKEAQSDGRYGIPWGNMREATTMCEGTASLPLSLSSGGFSRLISPMTTRVYAEKVYGVGFTGGRKHFLLPVFCDELVLQRQGINASGKRHDGKDGICYGGSGK